MINVKILKEIIKDIPDDTIICFGNDDAEIHIQEVNKAELCRCDEEEHVALCFSWSGDFYSDCSVETLYDESSDSGSISLL